MGGDARYYYIYLQNTFIDASFINYDWLNPANGVVITHHPVGLSILLLPFFLLAYIAASVFNYPLDGVSATFQAGISIAAIFYCVIGLIYLKKLLVLNGINDKVTAFIIPLLFFGTSLFHYTLNESGMSHVYSFSLITIFLYQGCKYVNESQAKNLLFAALIFGMIVLLRPNNGLIIFSVLFWFRSKDQFVSFAKKLFVNRTLYLGILIVLMMVALQVLTWLWKEDTLFVNRYTSYGFYWTHPQLIQMLFGFEAGFFIYTPLCFLFLLGLIAAYKENKFFFYSMAIFIGLLFYIFASYSAYTYFDGFGIRVLVDYYSLFAILGAKLFMFIAQYKFLFNTASTVAFFLVILNLIYCYQAENNILARSGMNFNKWKYIFLRTNKDYENCLGGSSDLTPFAKKQPEASLVNDIKFEQPFNFLGNEYGPTILFDSLGFNSKRIRLKIKIRRKEMVANASKDVLVCAMVENKLNKDNKKYLQFKLNETPSQKCCDDVEYNYSATMEAGFKSSDNLKVYLWNIKKQAFSIDEFSVQIYNYNY